MVPPSRWMSRPRPAVREFGTRWQATAHPARRLKIRRHPVALRPASPAAGRGPTNRGPQMLPPPRLRHLPRQIRPSIFRCPHRTFGRDLELMVPLPQGKLRRAQVIRRPPAHPRIRMLPSPLNPKTHPNPGLRDARPGSVAQSVSVVRVARPHPNTPAKARLNRCRRR